MDEDLYKPPSSDLELIQSRKGSALKGIIYGAIIDILGTLLFGILFGFIFSIILLSQGVAENELVNKISNIETWSLPSLIGMLGGTLISVFAGYVCAMKSIININRNAFILSIISVSFGLVMGGESYNTIEMLFMSGLTTGAVFFGANYWKSKNTKTT